MNHISAEASYVMQLVLSDNNKHKHHSTGFIANKVKYKVGEEHTAHLRLLI
jgi:hypothetical protein